MNIVVLGAAGFIGTNLTIQLAKNKKNNLVLVDKQFYLFEDIKKLNYSNVQYEVLDFETHAFWDNLLHGQDVVYHLISTTVPTTSNAQIAKEISANVSTTANFLDACVRCGVKKVVFLSSGGTVYGKDVICPIKEDVQLNPISSYGVQKIMIEKLLYLYHYLHGLDYRVIRLANPYGPWQKPNGIQGVVATFLHKMMKDEEIILFGDGSVVRDYIYIEDVVRAIENIVQGDAEYRVFNLGSGQGTSVTEVIKAIEEVLDKKAKIVYKEGRKVDVPINYLDVARYEKTYGALNPIGLCEGIEKTKQFYQKYYNI